jgi:hypothetical protein
MIFGGKIKDYVNQHDFVSDIQTPSRSYFLRELLMSFTTLVLVSGKYRKLSLCSNDLCFRTVSYHIGYQ